MHLGPLCMQLRAPIGFFLLYGANSSPEKVQHFLVSPNSIKIVPNGMFFGAATGSGVLLCWSRCNKTSTFWRDPPHPFKNGFFTLSTKLQTFYTINFFF